MNYSAQFISLITLVSSLITLAGCSATELDTPALSSDVDVINQSDRTGGTVLFGDAYTITVTGSNISPPAIHDGILTLWVSYSGGCEDHTFTFWQKRASNGPVQLWFTHDAASDHCEAYLTRKLTVKPVILPDSNTPVELLNPGNAPFSLQ